MANVLEFEKPLVELEAKIEELKNFSNEKGIDLSDEIRTLENKAQALKQSIYGNLTAWQKVQIARHVERPTALDYINNLIEGFIELHGDRYFGDDKAIVGGIGKFNGRPVTVLGNVKGKDTKENIMRNFGYAHPEGNRKALRLMQQAEKFNRPVLTFVDTPGAYCGTGAEERGQAEAIAKNLFHMISLKVPIIVTIIGEGGSGGALAIGLGDRTLMLEYAIFSIISPESFASILWKDAGRAQEAAEVMKLTAPHLLEMGIVDKIVAEPLGGAHKDPGKMYTTLKDAIAESLAEVAGMSTETMLEQRYQKFRSIGQVISG
ncbi:acetyl-CoA carboxylase carboxyltransferase subunit alpha [Thermincola potens]|uniref:Acetyl-coenzyme A carboxylase carboxyl transferase subunit alpha n=1 Tax=Thermincola potens (strain JR) TaxID=635013 RepID=D5XA35_THEPJ|nr:acetyl-CoA carboxylase carboxyltransferase subunit alpha [Thermincola potens]ADG83168.1 acetyl-CoA carboxylase, carboxyl transferase, alpha subunit [Thermincola potens JR]